MADLTKAVAESHALAPHQTGASRKEARTQVRTAARTETPLHATADAHVSKIEVALRYAFAAARRTLAPGKHKIDLAMTVLREELEATLPKVLHKTVVAGGSTAGVLLWQQMRTAGDYEGHPFHGNQWTSGFTSSPAFKAWFKESKVVDASGKPLVLYHGTTKPITEFANPASKVDWDTGYSGEGYYFADVQTANIYSGEKKPPTTYDVEGNIAAPLPADYPTGANVIPVYLRMEKPLRVQERKGGDDQIIAVAKAVGIKVPTDVDGINVSRKMPGLSKDITKALRSHGYDGVIYAHANSSHGEYMVLDPEQIKSVVSRFDPKNPRGLGFRTLKRGESPQVDFAFDRQSDAAVTWADKHAAELIDGITETSREAINNSVAEFLETGDWSEHVDEILEAVGDTARANLIARNESMIAVHEGQREAWDQAIDEGLLTGEEMREWIVVGDEKVCPICQGLDGKRAKLGQSYISDEGEAYEGPPAHVSCRCSEGIV